MPSIRSTLLYSKVVEIMMVSLRYILVKSELTSRQPLKSLLSYCKTSSGKTLIVFGESSDTKIFRVNNWEF